MIHRIESNYESGVYFIAFSSSSSGSKSSSTGSSSSDSGRSSSDSSGSGGSSSGGSSSSGSSSSSVATIARPSGGPASGSVLVTGIMRRVLSDGKIFLPSGELR